MGTSILDIIRGIRSDRKRALEITESVATGSPFDRIRVSEADGIESRLSRVREAAKRGEINLEESIVKEIEEGLSAVKGTREIARLRALGIVKEAEARAKAREEKGHLTEERIIEKLHISPEIAKKIKENSQAVIAEAQENIRKLEEEKRIEKEKERKEVARRSKRI